MLKKFSEHPKAQAWVDTVDKGPDGCDFYLWSYKTLVAGVEDGVAFCRGTFSATTRKHIGWFAKMVGLTYYDFKRMAEGRYSLDLKTGEVIQPQAA